MTALLNCQSNFSFLQAASHPHELVEQAAALGYTAIALCDDCSLAGIVRAWKAARQQRIKLICGARFRLDDGLQLLLLAPNRRAYSELCGLISHARLRSSKGRYSLDRQTLLRYSNYTLAIWLAEHNAPDEQAVFLKKAFSQGLWLGVALHNHAQQQQRYLAHYALACRHQLPLVACPSALMHCRKRQPLHDVLCAIRQHCRVTELGRNKLHNSEYYIKPPTLLERDYPAALLAETAHIAALCNFDLAELRYQYPNEVVPAGQSASSHLRQLTEMGAMQRWPQGVPAAVEQCLDKELALIAELDYEHYFLTVYDIVQFARSRQILCQGRGSAANSAVCYCLFITEVDPSRSQLLFERFISRERDEPPDIDVDFEHERREEVIQYIYRKYGRSHASLTATVIRYRRRSALRDVGKALGLDTQLIARLSKNIAWWDNSADMEQRLAELGMPPQEARSQQFIQLVNDILDVPRHLSQHVGGFVVSRDTLTSLVPQENAAMAERTIIQWDKEDLEALGMMKIDILALGMLSALRRSLAYISHRHGKEMRLMDIPAEDPATYEMLCQADSIGVFQVESRAQMTMLPRLQPRCFYDLVIQIAIVRPGPIQGGMVHPFLRRRQGLEVEDYANEAIEEVLKRTLGVPIFQEQVIQLAMVAAGFSGGEADQLRRAMASWGKNGHLDNFKQKLIAGMLARGYSQDFAERLFSQMKGFGAYGFPESHSASFALLAYASAWLKCHYPAEFYCGLLNSQPMGFYSASQLTQDARRHRVDILPVCINHSDWQHSLEEQGGQMAIRLGFRIIKGISQQSAQRIAKLRLQTAFRSMQDCINRLRSEAHFNTHQLALLARSDSFKSFDLHRYQSYWLVQSPASPPLFSHRPSPATLSLKKPTASEALQQDYACTGLSLHHHPLQLLRSHAMLTGCHCAEQLSTLRDGQQLKIAGLVTCRQRPGSAAGVMFMTLEDETGNSNIVVWPAQQQRFRSAILQGTLLLIDGRVQKSLQHNAPAVIHIIAHHIQDLSVELNIDYPSHDFH